MSKYGSQLSGLFEEEKLNTRVDLERMPTRRCGRWRGLCGGSRCGCGSGCCGGNNRLKAGLGVSCSESFRSQTVVRFEADHHCVATGLHWLWHGPPTEFTFDGL